MWKTLAGLAVLLGSRFRDCAKNLVRLRWWKTQPPSPPYQGDLSLNSPLIRGARGVKNDERWVSCTVSFAGTTGVEFLHSL